MSVFSAKIFSNQGIQRFLVTAATICLFLYILLAVAFALSNLGVGWLSFCDHFFSLGDGQFMFGLPISGVAAAAIVCVFQVVAPSATDSNGQVSFEAFGAKFSGPAAPATLWIVTYLALVLSIVAVTGTGKDTKGEKVAGTAVDQASQMASQK